MFTEWLSLNRIGRRTVNISFGQTHKKLKAWGAIKIDLNAAETSLEIVRINTVKWDHIFMIAL